MIKKNSWVIIGVLFVLACQPMNKKETWIKEIENVENQFASYAADHGIKAAFVEFAAPDAVIMRNNTVYKGIAAIEELYSQQDLSNVTLEWKPDFIDVSDSGDLAYTYGKYRYSVTAVDGTVQTSEGIFHTVWKRQPDGAWKFVWD